MSARRWNADRASICPASVALVRAISAIFRSLPECSLGARPSDVRSAPHSPLRWSGAAVARKNDMLRQFKKCTAAFAAITMFASSAASAAPRTADPLVALSVLGSAESHAAVCASGSGSPVCGGQSSAIPVAGSAAALETSTTQEDASGPTVRGSMWPLWISLGAVLIGWSWILLDDDEDGEVNLPISP